MLYIPAAAMTECLDFCIPCKYRFLRKMIKIAQKLQKEMYMCFICYRAIEIMERAHVFCMGRGNGMIAYTTLSMTNGVFFWIASPQTARNDKKYGNKE
jgi:hypothetical protein